MVGVAGFEPATLWSQTRCATRLRYTPSSLVIVILLMFSTKERIENVTICELLLLRLGVYWGY